MNEKPRTPRRIPISERVKQTPDLQQGAPFGSSDTGGGNHGDFLGTSESRLDELTHTAVTGIYDWGSINETYQIGDDGCSLVDERVAPISRPLSRCGTARLLTADIANEHHILLVSDEVDPEELEALAISIWDTAAWVEPGKLLLCDGVTLQGPWRVDDHFLPQVGTRLTSAWVLHSPVQRGSAPSERLRVTDQWAQAFPQGMPAGTELLVLQSLYRMARRLAGSIRIRTIDSGELVTPDPDSAVTFTLYCPRWLDPQELIDILREKFPTIMDSRDVGTLAHSPNQKELKTVQRIAESVGEVSQEVRRRIEQDRADALDSSPVVNSYALVISGDNKQRIMCEVKVVKDLPPVLRWTPWESPIIVEYRLRWLQPKARQSSPRLSRMARRERIGVTNDIESATSLIIGALGGYVVDEDGFLVALEG